MKHYLLITVLLFTTTGFSITPEKMNFVAVIRNNQNSLASNQQIGVKLSILQDSITGTPVYSETHSPKADTYGIINIEIGTGISTKGVFNQIDWSHGNFFLKTEIDPQGGTNFEIASTSRFVSVPFVFHATKANYINTIQNETTRALEAEEQLLHKMNELNVELNKLEIKLQSYIK